MPNELFRRHFLKAGVGFIGAAAGKVLFSDFSTVVLAQSTRQLEWRYCRKCQALFYDGYGKKGRCPTGNGHVAQGLNFFLAYDTPETPTAQAAWRFCNKCYMMFYDGYPNKGVCPAGGGHVAQGYNFVLSHDIPASGLEQNAWRFCNKCHAMFYDGYENKGTCSAGGGHVAAGYNFVLRFKGNLEDDVQLVPCSPPSCY
ncbi:hypothetical protein [Fischerella thermalis]|jgi:hypothetical protein|uniref:hypothetical protein n=1 Tax=Fischerella thermalis TaxID=372787 RepID=UPI0019F313BF|nr:hypothetical protein [Fischerella thermalis]MBF1987863.1 hypothetical protein [Fischerella thermalis M58_A2018_009]